MLLFHLCTVSRRFHSRALGYQTNQMSDLLNHEERELYAQALTALNDSGVDYMLGGALAVYHYTDWWRNTHDIDVYVTPENLDRARSSLDAAGFRDIGEQAEGDHQWIYHAAQSPIIVDVIWRFANLANYVAPDWIKRASRGRFLDHDVLFLPLEELVWVKIFVVNRHRCDWPDIMRVARAQCLRLDWSRLLNLIGEHWLLLAGLIDVFDWQYPGSMDCIPDGIRRELSQRRLEYRGSPAEADREHLLDPWLHLRMDTYLCDSER